MGISFRETSVISNTFELPSSGSQVALAPASEHAERCWKDAVDETRRRSPASFEQWFSSVQFDGLEHGVLSLSARDEWVRDWVVAHFLPDLLANLERKLG